MTIPTLPPYPSRGSAPETFSLQADAFVAAMPAWGVAVQAVGDAADADAVAAAASAAAADASASAANYKGVYSAGTTYQIGQSVSYSSARYYAKTVNTGLTPVDGANWGLVNEVPAQTGNAGKVLGTNGTTTSWVLGLPVQTGHAGKVLGTDGTTPTWGNAIVVYSYDNRATLRTLSPTPSAMLAVEGLGLFLWTSGSTEPDDDETAFATASGVWTMVAADPEYVIASLMQGDDAIAVVAAEAAANAAADAVATKILEGSFSMSATSLATITSTSFTATVTGAAVGDGVVVNPGDGFGTSAADKGKLSYVAYVSSANTVTVTIRNASASTANMTASTWSVFVIKQ